MYYIGKSWFDPNFFLGDWFDSDFLYSEQDSDGDNLPEEGIVEVDQNQGGAGKVGGGRSVGGVVMEEQEQQRKDALRRRNDLILCFVVTESF